MFAHDGQAQATWKVCTQRDSPGSSTSAKSGVSDCLVDRSSITMRKRVQEMRK